MPANEEVNYMNKIAKALANLTRKIAVSANGAASTMGTYQPKEPKMLKSKDCLGRICG